MVGNSIIIPIKRHRASSSARITLLNINGFMIMLEPEVRVIVLSFVITLIFPDRTITRL